MGFFRRAIASITRKMGKTAILLVLVFVLGNVIAGAISIEQSIRNTESSILRGIVPVTTIDIDWRPELEHEDVKFLTVEQIEQLGALDMVEFFDYSTSAGLVTSDMKRYKDPAVYGSSAMWGPGGEVQTAWFSLTGGQSGVILDRKMGKIEIVDGRELNDEEVQSGKNVVVISRQLAELNGLHVGSAFTLNYEIYNYADYEMSARDIDGSGIYEEPKPTKVLEFEFTVVGLFDRVGPPPASDEHGNIDWVEMERPNTIYTSNKAINSINSLGMAELRLANPQEDFGDDSPYLTPIFVLNDAENLSAFSDAAKALLPDYFRVIDNTSAFRAITAPMQNMSSIAMIILWVGIGASLVILSLLITLFLRDRRHEIGIYLSLGERKLKVVGQILTEVMIISVIAITLSLFSGNIVSGILSNNMIENEVIASQQANEFGSGSFYQDYSVLDSMGYVAEVTLEDMAAQYNVSLGADIILYFFAVGLLTVLVSTLVPILYVLRLNPRKILM